MTLTLYRYINKKMDYKKIIADGEKAIQENDVKALKKALDDAIKYKKETGDELAEALLVQIPGELMDKLNK